MVLKNLGEDRYKDADVENGVENMGRRRVRWDEARVAWAYIHYQI